MTEERKILRPTKTSLLLLQIASLAHSTHGRVLCNLVSCHYKSIAIQEQLYQKPATAGYWPKTDSAS